MTEPLGWGGAGIRRPANKREHHREHDQPVECATHDNECEDAEVVQPEQMTRSTSQHEDANSLCHRDTCEDGAPHVHECMRSAVEARARNVRESRRNVQTELNGEARRCNKIHHRDGVDVDAVRTCTVRIRTAGERPTERRRSLHR
jgi:hypothetical protein